MNSSDGGAEQPRPRSGPRAHYPEEQSSKSRRRWFIVLSIGVVIAGVIIAYLGYRQFADPPVSGEATGYEVTGPDTIMVQYTVNRNDPDRAVACVIRARAQDGAEVGRREILIAPSNQTQIGARALVKTSREPVIGEVFGCTTNIPPYLEAAS